MDAKEQVVKQIMYYLEMSTIIGAGVLEGKSKKKVESRRLVQIFYLGFIDGMCQIAGLSQQEHSVIEKIIITESEIIKDLKISNKEFPLDDWYEFNLSTREGIWDKIEGRVLYYGGLTARVHAAIINERLNRSEYGNSNALNAIGVAMHYKDLTKAKFRAEIDKEIEKTLLLDKKAWGSQGEKN
jgi:hypothetical protein